MSEQHDRVRSYRRELLRAVGVGSVLATVGGTAAATDGGDDAGSESGGQSGDQDDVADRRDGHGGRVRVVETLIRGPPTDPERPADFFFQPTGLHVQPGDVVRFAFVTPDHNVVSYHPAFGMRRRVPTGVGPISSPIRGWRPESIDDDQIEPPAELLADGEAGPAGTGDTAADDGPRPDTWLQAFETPGVYDLLCSPHEQFGMAMRVVVGDVTGAAFETSDPAALAEPRPGPAGLARQTLTDPALAPSAIVERGEVPWESLESTRDSEIGTQPGETEAEPGTGNGTTADSESE